MSISGTFYQLRTSFSCRPRQLGTATVKHYINLRSLLTSVGCVPGKPAIRVASVIVPVKPSTLNLATISNTFRDLHRLAQLTRVCWLYSRETCNTSSLNYIPSKARQLKLIFISTFMLENQLGGTFFFITPRLFLGDQEVSRVVG